MYLPEGLEDTPLSGKESVHGKNPTWHYLTLECEPS